MYQPSRRIFITLTALLCVFAQLIAVKHSSTALAQNKPETVTKETLQKAPIGAPDVQATGIKKGEVKPGQKIDVSLERPNGFGGWTQTVRDENTGEIVEERVFDAQGNLRELTTYQEGGIERKSEYDQKGYATKDTRNTRFEKTELEYFPGGHSAGIKRKIRTQFDTLERQTNRTVEEWTKPITAHDRKFKGKEEITTYENEHDFRGSTKTREFDEPILPSGEGVFRIEMRFGYRAETRHHSGLYLFTIRDPSDSETTICITDDQTANGTFSGTVQTSTSKANKSQNEAQLVDKFVEIEGRRSKLSEANSVLTWTTTANAQEEQILLKDTSNHTFANIEVPLSQTSISRPTSFAIPTGGQQGQPFEIDGPCDGDLTNTTVKIGDEAVPILAESPRKIVARNLTKQPGLSTLEYRERDTVIECPFRSIRVRLSAPRTNLLRGEQTTLTMTIDGLEQLKENLPWDLVDMTPNVLIIKEGNKQQGVIHPAEVNASGAYFKQFTLEGIQRGAFNINATVSWTNVCQRRAT